jgi:hypothetical protein
MTDIGSQLRAAREAQDLTLEQVFKATRIKQPFLEAIEANQFHALPGPVQARGFVRSYANYLGLDGEHLASALDADKTSAPAVRPLTPPPAQQPIVTPPPSARPIVQAPPKPAIVAPPKPAVAQPEKSTQQSGTRPALRLPTLALNSSKPSSASSRGGIPTWLLIAGAVVLFVLGAVLVISALSSAGQPSAPRELSDVPNSIETLPADASAERLAASLGGGPVSITLKAGEHVWARITIDGQTAFEGMLDPNTVKDWQAADQIIVETGNAAALTVVHQGQASVLGKRGEIVARAWGREGAVDVPLAVPEATPQATAALTNTVP